MVTRRWVPVWAGLMVLLGVLSPVGATPAYAAELAVTQVGVGFDPPDVTAGMQERVTTTVEFCTPAGGAEGDTVTVGLPAVLTGWPTTATITKAGGPVMFTGTIANSVATFTLTAAGAAEGSTCLEATLTAHSGTTPAGDYDLVYTVNGAQVDAGTLTVYPSTNLVLEKTTAAAGPQLVGSTVEFQLTPSNKGLSPAAAGWSVTEVLPAGLTLESMAGTGYTCANLTCTAQAPLNAGAAGAPVTVKAKVTAPGAQKNVAYVQPRAGDVAETNPLTIPTTATDTDASPTDNDASASITGVAPAMNLTLTSASSPAGPYAPGQEVEVTLTPANAGASAPAAAGWSVTALLPPELTLVSMTGTGYACGNLTCTAQGPLGPTASGDPVTLRVKTTAPGAFPLVAYVSPAAGDVAETNPLVVPTLSTDTAASATDNDTSQAVSVNRPDLNLSVEAALVTTGGQAAGNEMEIRITASSTGAAPAAAGWSVTALLPPELTLVSMTGTGYACGNLTCTAQAPLAQGSVSQPVTLRVKTTAPGTFPVVAYVSPAPGDAETNPLVVPTLSTDAAASATDNDTSVAITVLPSPAAPARPLPQTGSAVGLWQLLLAAGSVLAGAGLLVSARRRRS